MIPPVLRFALAAVRDAADRPAELAELAGSAELARRIGELAEAAADLLIADAAGAFDAGPSVAEADELAHAQATITASGRVQELAAHLRRAILDFAKA